MIKEIKNNQIKLGIDITSFINKFYNKIKFNLKLDQISFIDDKYFLIIDYPNIKEIIDEEKFDILDYNSYEQKLFNFITSGTEKLSKKDAILFCNANIYYEKNNIKKRDLIDNINEFLYSECDIDGYKIFLEY